MWQKEKNINGPEIYNTFKLENNFKPIWQNYFLWLLASFQFSWPDMEDSSFFHVEV